MLVHPWVAALDDAEWREWLGRNDFGQLVASGRGRDVPVVVPTHFRYDGATTVELHLARPNPVWAAIEENPIVLLTVVGDYVYVPSTWGAAPGTDPALGIATSYYATVQLTCAATVVDDDAAKAAILRRQLGRLQPEAGYAPVDETAEHYARRLPQIRGLRLDVTAMRAKFKYGGNKTPDHRAVIAGRLADRDGPMDAAAREHLLRRTEA
ncbi:MAG TPA: FMN-binding negative transcriptional regulator [Mycobacteriales bacterium]|nr:FMN-binding negative transcriptional regulator [Mycobacteriales bacterium]